MPIRPGLAGFDQRRVDSLVHYPFGKRATRIPDRRRSADALVHRARSRVENGATACVAGWAPTSAAHKAGGQLLDPQLLMSNQGSVIGGLGSSN